ncbi:MAG TPA: bifunctional phosphopantothenoylcysteine decarboxylase/phosphopantothenate--cysteine ligase CoaBC [Cryomorphaceae bacterium]|jgi:phosphopantothenoylcysteine decarboxylase/phosphopantothenate--cysteine ligase|nr:bifunctional phosphopantothenoylcysteine decarboxylase/phosphopantothenate--cysteine ligase CoaBC [Cryomorphaceae bacterium]
MSSLAGKHVLIGITGGIAAYKLPFLVRLLRAQEAEVRILMTPAAEDFVTPLTLAALSGQPVHHHLVERLPGQTSWNNHVAHAEWADVYILAPATANTLAKAVQGLCDNLVMATYLSAKCPIIWAPAMDLDMYAHPSTQQNIGTLKAWGQHVLPSPAGPLASGLTGAGRMAEPETILHAALRTLGTRPFWQGKRVLLTSGPTEEALDDVRYVTNGSSGRMGDGLARAFSAAGADLHWVHGPSHVQTPDLPGATYYPVRSAEEMWTAVKDMQVDFDLCICAAAVADFRPSKRHVGKRKKAAGMPSTEWVENPDILARLGEAKKSDPSKLHQRIIGFALEAEWNEAEALRKAQDKHADLIVLNQVGDPQGGMHTETNRIALVSHSGVEEWPVASKEALGESLVRWIETHWSL